MAGLDQQLINVLAAIAARGNNPGPLALLKEMQKAKFNGVEFEFELYNVEQKADPINFDGHPWNSDIYFMFTKFRVKPLRVEGGQRPAVEERVAYDVDVEAGEIAEIEFPGPRKELPRGS